MIGNNNYSLTPLIGRGIVYNIEKYVYWITMILGIISIILCMLLKYRRAM